MRTPKRLRMLEQRLNQNKIELEHRESVKKVRRRKITNRDFCSHSSSPESGLQVLRLTRNRGGLLAFDEIGDGGSQGAESVKAHQRRQQLGDMNGRKAHIAGVLSDIQDVVSNCDRLRGSKRLKRQSEEGKEGGRLYDDPCGLIVVISSAQMGERANNKKSTFGVKSGSIIVRCRWFIFRAREKENGSSWDRLCDSDV
ncbi:unnamed protein product [Lactuca saligna]|uniref:Uncharacterized protein n=1 Tax=Lactuca saligna TaxID=75948 RepID=A0AA35VC99_LACSI|nr:unnamed protein product [Lactuca saligna]